MENATVLGVKWSYLDEFRNTFVHTHKHACMHEILEQSRSKDVGSNVYTQQPDSRHRLGSLGHPLPTNTEVLKEQRDTLKRGRD